MMKFMVPFNQTGDDSVIHLSLWRFVTAICLRLREATGVPKLQHRSERFSAWHFAHGFNVLPPPFRNLPQRFRWNLPMCWLT
jgi:hypothetical protein